MPSRDSRELSPYYVLRDPLPPGSYDAGGWDEDEVHLKDYWRVLVKHRRTILGVFAAIVATTAIVTFTMERQFTATSKIQIERQAPKIAPVQEVQQVETAGYDKYDFYQTQYEILESRTIAARVIKALGLDVDSRFVGDGRPGLVGSIVGGVKSLFVGPGEEQEGLPQELGVDPKLVDRYIGALSIDPVRNSRLVNVRFTSADPELASQVANRHVEEYVNASLESRLETTARAKEFLEQELAKARDRVSSSEVALNEFRRREGIVSLGGDEGDIVSSRLQDLNQRFTEAQARRIELESQYDLIQSRDFESLPAVAASPTVQNLKQQLSEANAKRAELARKFKPGYPKMAEAIGKAEELESRLQSEIGKIVSGIESEFLAAKAREAELGQRLEEQRQLALSQKDVGADYATLERDVDTARQLYSNLLQRLKDVGVAEEIRVTNVSVVDRAAVPFRPSSPKTMLNLVLASVLGLMLGVGLSFFMEYMDDTVKTPEDVERLIRVPTLGVVPSFETPAVAYGGYGYGYGRKRRKMQNDPGEESGATVPAVHGKDEHGRGSELVVSKHPRSVVAEAYRTIRTGILMSSADAPPQVILFTSGSAGEGKTVTTVNEAATLVQSGGRVLLVDADIRKPRIHRLFDLANGAGLSTYLAGQSDLESVIHEMELGKFGNGNGAMGDISGTFSVIPSGPLPPNPAELLGSRKMRETIEQLRGRYDYILLDTPPVLPVTDAVLLSAASDGVVLVVRGQETPADVVTKARDRLARMRAKLIGVVLNDVDVTSADYEQYHRYQYSYYGETETA